MKKKFLTVSLIFAFICTALIGFYTLTASAAIHTILYVGGTEVTEQNASDVFGDGTVSFDSTTNTLTLNNATITECFTEEFFGEDTYFGIYCEANEFNLQLVGENTIYLSEGIDNDSYYAVYSSGAMNVGGNGSLSVTSFGGIIAMGDITVKNCSIESTGIAITSMGEVSLDNVTLEAKSAIGAFDDVTLTNSTIVAGENIVMMDGAGSFLVEDSTITVVNGQYNSPIDVPGNVTIKNSTLNLNVNAVEEESAMGILAGNQLTLENVQANIELRTKAGYALMGMEKVTIKKSNLTLSTVSLADSAIGINSIGNITIEESLLEIDVRGGDDLSAGIGTMNGKVEIKDSTLKLTTSGNRVVGILGVNIDLINCNGFVEVMATGEGELMGAGLGTNGGTLTINGGVLNIEATGSVDSDAFGILIEGATPPTFIDANITIRGSGAASMYAPNLNSYGREYAIEASEDIDCDTPVEYNPENIHDYKYLYIHGWYTVTFDANGGTGTMESEDGYCGLCILPVNRFTAPEGKQFLGWAYSADGDVINKTKIEVLQDITLYAIWEDIPHTHNFAPATCTAPKTCVCGATEGVALEHSFAPATCTAPKTCVCGATEGVALEHSFAPATCTAPKICICGLTEGVALGHTYSTEWSSDSNEHFMTCSCGAKQRTGIHVDSNENGTCDVCGYALTTASNDNDGLGTGAIVGIVIGSVAVAGVGGFALLWFVIKKKSFADLIAVFKK